MAAPTVTTGALPQHVRDLLIERLRERRLELPLLPDVAAKVLDLVNQENADAAQLSAILHGDQALAGHVLRLANSPAYMPRMPIVSLQQAVSRLGMATLRDIVVTVSVHSRVFSVPGFERVIGFLWRHSIGAAFYAREIARLRRRNVEGAFLCGLLHDIGKPVLLTSLLDLQSETRTPLELPAIEAAMEEFHLAVGTLLAEEWRLPEQVRSAVRWHHDWHGAAAQSEVAMMTCLADRLSYYAVQGGGAEAQQQAADAIRRHEVLQDLNLYPDEVDQLLDKRSEILERVEALEV